LFEGTSGADLIESVNRFKAVSTISVVYKLDRFVNTWNSITSDPQIISLKAKPFSLRDGGKKRERERERERREIANLFSSS
jgi:hypothetical protein